MATPRCLTTAIPQRDADALAVAAPVQVAIAADPSALVRVQNVTTETGQRAGHGPSTSWLTRDGEYVVERAARRAGLAQLPTAA